MNNLFDNKVKEKLKEWNWKCDIEEGKLMLIELMVKRQNGIYNSYTEDGFLDSMGLTRKDGAPNSIGKTFMMHMLYASSNNRPPAFEAMKKYRN